MDYETLISILTGNGGALVAVLIAAWALGTGRVFPKGTVDKLVASHDVALEELKSQHETTITELKRVQTQALKEARDQASLWRTTADRKDQEMAELTLRYEGALAARNDWIANKILPAILHFEERGRVLLDRLGGGGA